MKTNMSAKETAKRYLLFIFSLFVCGLGVAITRHAELGVSPISSVANVISCKFEFLSFGTWLIIWNCLPILGQIIILRKDFKIIQLLQIPLSFLFGYFTDFWVWVVHFFPKGIYPVKIVLVLVGIVILGFGISLSVTANVIMNSGEAFVKALSDKTGIVFGNLKIGFDVSCVILAVVLSLILFNFKIIGTREGTIITALLTGAVVKFFQKRTGKTLNALLEK